MMNKDKLYSFAKIVCESLQVTDLNLTIETINGPAWADPVTTGTLVIQYNVNLGVSRFGWWDGSQWVYAGAASVTSGLATITATNAYVDVTHNLGLTPDLGRLHVTPGEDIGGRYWWVDTISSTTFRLNMSSIDYYDHVFGWSYV